MPTSGSFRKRELLLVILLVFLAFLPALNAGWIWDDDRYVTTNLALRSWGGLWRIWTGLHTEPQYYPVTHTGLWIQYQLWGLHPSGYHAVSVGLQAANAALLWLALEALAVSGAWFAAALWAVHPVQTETVAWITEQKNLLSVLFSLLSLHAWLRGQTAAMLAFFVCALLSKSTAAVLPAAILVLVWWKNGRIERRDARPLAPMFVAGAAMGLLTALLERHAGAAGPDWAFSAAERVLIAGRALWFYADTLLCPFPLSFIYPRWDLDAGSAVQWLFPAAALMVLFALFLARKRFGRGPAAAAFLFAGILFPALGFLNVYPMRYSFVADHFQYLAGASLLALAAAGLQRFRRVPIVLVVFMSMLTFERSRVFADSETLWRDTAAKNPDSWMVRYNMGAALAGRGRWKEAEDWIRSAAALKPGDAGIHNNLGNLLVAAGRPEQGVEEFRLARRFDPAGAEACNNLGAALVKLGKTRDAVTQYQQAVRLKPGFALAWFNLGQAQAELGRYREAADSLQEALRVQPDLAVAARDLADVRRRLALPGASRYNK